MSRRNKRNTGDDGPSGNWMTTYSDLVTLLLTFFVLLFSLSNIDNEKFEKVSRSLSSAFLNIDYGESFVFPSGKSYIDSSIKPSNDKEKGLHVENSQDNQNAAEVEIIEEAYEIISQKSEKLKREMEVRIKEYGLENYVSVVREEHNVIFRIDSVILFDLGKADIKDSGKDILRDLGKLLNTINQDILIQGHTDDLPINTMFFPTNWELSTKRATNVVLFLVEDCNLDPEKLTATGNGEYRPIKPNDSEENRMYNRRIDIAITQRYTENEE